MDREPLTAALGNDPQAAIALGCRIVATVGVDERRQADIPFEIARNGDRATVLQAAEAYARVADGRAAGWMAEGAASLSDPDGIVVDPLTLPIHIENYDVDRWIALDQDWRRRALRRSGPRDCRSERGNAAPLPRRRRRQRADGHSRRTHWPSRTVVHPELRSRRWRSGRPSTAAVDIYRQITVINPERYLREYAQALAKLAEWSSSSPTG